jgi:hypothetical protein
VEAGSPSLVNDVLIALSARAIGAIVTTSNKRNFAAICRVRPFKLATSIADARATGAWPLCRRPQPSSQRREDGAAVDDQRLARASGYLIGGILGVCCASIGTPAPTTARSREAMNNVRELIE